ncbi:diguanylate cyclase/phosphodiesterase [Duganella sp. CF458]|uniref:bifunctional diguanylate cyclase/phosphodiesterase n=1 Tax=Duganella sp. CF458 TaxID=1884368 RepID=UPI0008E67C1F|nr:EAL domain-containing protein [Duganella sp. CF458]SFG68495.1 diguanylate cyclase/phosphodiesterase [Duganella sp. CF458]
MRFRSLESRIVTLFLVLLIVVQLVGLVVIQRGIDSNARSAIAAELVNGSKVFARLMDQNAENLRNGARLLSRDAGFLSAIGNTDDDDRATIESALANHGRRIKAAMTMLVSPERKVVASTSDAQAAGLEHMVMAMLDKAEQGDGANGVAIVERLPYQVVVVPVKAPVTIGFVVMTFPLDERLARDMQETTALQTLLLTRDPNGRWLPVASSLASAAVERIMSHLQGMGGMPGAAFDVDIGGDKLSVHMTKIGEDDGNAAVAMLGRSIDEATAEYARLERWLLGLTVAGMVVCVIASVVTAKRIAQPLRQLADTAKKLEQGDYKVDIASSRADEIGALAHAFGSMRDGIAKREQEIRRLAYWDPLTNLPNRAQFLLLLNEAIGEARKRGGSVYVLMMDLDRFKHVNDVMGHSFGDALLKQVAGRLLQKLANRRNPAQVARLGGDEFAVLLPGSGLDQAVVVAAEILQALESPLSLDEQMVDIGAGIGIAGFPDHGMDGEELLGKSEIAMYTAKQRNEGAVVYEDAIDKGSQQSLSLLTELRQAVESNELRLFVQPKVTLATGHVVGMEALVRWQHPVRGNVFPDQFIPFAEQTGFIRVITHWVLERSAELCHQLAQRGIHLKVSVNLSTRDLLDQELPFKFGEIFMRHHVSPGAFCLEITESAIMEDPVRAQQTLERLHSMGCDLSIDDFGTGYSSLAYLKRLPVDELKIDKSFVLNMANDLGDAKIVRSTIDLGHNMGLRVVAEGIESEAAWCILAEMGCDQGQGYYMSRPIPASELASWVENWKATALAE